MKNFLLQKTKLGKSPWLLIHLNPTSNGEVEYKPFTNYINWLTDIKGYSANSVDQYAGHVARFLDFTYEASFIVADSDFSNLIYLYQEYLLFGTESKNTEVALLAKRLGKTKQTAIVSMAQGIESAIKLFIVYQITKSESIEASNIFSQYFVQTSFRSKKEIKSIKDNSWLQATIRGSLSSIIPISRTSIFAKAKNIAKRQASNKNYSLVKAFPLEHAVDFLTQKNNSKMFNRDMSFISLLAAAGPRSIEALQVQISDIDVENKLIYLRPPFDRRTGLTDTEFRKLAWKGRVTEETFLLEPFATIFWKHFNNYIQESYRTNVNHNFVFQKNDGRPMFTLDRSNRNKLFKQYVNTSQIKGLDDLSLHSFRHMYGFYALNYLPINHGESYGLPLEYVQILMGHASAKSTEVYAVHDQDMIRMNIELVNKITKEINVDTAKLKELYIQRQIENLQKLKSSLR